MKLMKERKKQMPSKKIYLYIDNKLSKEYESIHKASSDLNISRQTIHNYCNNKVKNKKYDLRWE